jgi:hypothetical protein
MKAEITKRCSVVCEVGSIVEISEGQFKALGDFCKEVGKTAENTEKKVTKRKSNA